jgi:rSAM/selenodomain-associated transferase 2
MTKGGIVQRTNEIKAFSDLSIIVPVYRDDAALTALLLQLRAARDQGVEVIVVGTSGDASAESIAAQYAVRYIVSEKGRGTQLALGANASARSKLWFVHADSVLPSDAPQLVVAALASHHWGRFDVQLDDPRLTLRCVAAVMNWRSRWSRIFTGDQAMFVRRDLYVAVGGFQHIPLMEDIAISRSLKRFPGAGHPACLHAKVTTSARKWQRGGVLKTILSMAWWRFRFWMGANPNTLAKAYYRESH